MNVAKRIELLSPAQKRALTHIDNQWRAKGYAVWQLTGEEIRTLEALYRAGVVEHVETIEHTSGSRGNFGRGHYKSHTEYETRVRPVGALTPGDTSARDTVLDWIASL